MLLSVTTMQASPEHLLSAAIMSAPAALAMAKLSYPETEESHTKTQEDVYIEHMYVSYTPCPEKKVPLYDYNSRISRPIL